MSDWNEAIRAKEVWMPVVGYEKIYSISSFGRIRNIKRNKFLNPSPDKKGYYHVTLCGHKKHLSRGVAPLVCRAFHGEPKPGYECAHLDGKPGNNRASNLSWCTRKENHSHKKLHGTHQWGDGTGNAHLDERAVKELRDIYARGEASTRKLARKYGVDRKTIRQAIKRRSWPHVI